MCLKELSSHKSLRACSPGTSTQAVISNEARGSFYPFSFKSYSSRDIGTFACSEFNVWRGKKREGEYGVREERAEEERDVERYM